MSDNKDGTFEIDWSDFNKKFFEYALKTAPEAAEKGMFEALGELEHDCDTVTPKTPHLHGNLRGDKTLILEGITKSTVTEKTGGTGKDHARSGSAPAPTQGASSIIAKLIFRMPYAAKWHEAVDKEWSQGGVNWSEAGVGPKYCESKLMMFARKYFNIVATRIKEASGG